MGTTSLSTSGLDKFFLEFIKPGFEVGFYTNSKLYDRFKTDTETCLGKYGVTKVLSATPTSFRASSTTTYPTSNASTWREFTYYMKRLYGQLQFDGLAIACGKGMGAVKELVKGETEALMSYVPRKLNKIYWGDGSGRLAIVKTGATSTSMTLDGDTTNWGLFGIDSNGYTNPGQYLFEGMQIDVYPATPGSVESEENTITALSDDGAGTNTATITSATFTSNAFVYDHDTYATTEAAGTGVPMGIAGIISNANPYVGSTATSAFQGVNRSSAGYDWSNAQVFDMGSAIGSPAVVTEIKMLEVIQSAEKWGKVSVIITNPFIWRALYVILKADKTMPNDPGYWGGLTGMKFYGGRANGIPIVWDDDCPDGRMYFIDDSTIKISAPEKNGFNWESGSSGHILTKLEGKDEFTAHMRHYYNMTCTKPKANALLRYVKHAAS